MQSKEVNLTQVRGIVVDLIKEKYNMNINSFSESEIPQNIGITQKPVSIRAALSEGGSTSIPILAKLCEHFNLGKLTSSVEVVKTITYSLQK